MNRYGINVGGVKFLHWHLGGNGRTDSSGSTTKINNDARLRTSSEALPQPCDGFRNEEFGTAAGHKNTGIDGNAKSAEAGPPKNEFERLTGSAAANPFRELFGARRLGQQQLRFFLCEDTASRPQQGDNLGKTGAGN
jgi:hypothetical protein